MRISQLLDRYNETWPDCKDEIGESFVDQRARVLENLIDFTSAPFTLQRICELLCDHSKRQYTSTRKLACAFDKLTSVQSTLGIMHPSVYEEAKRDRARKEELAAAAAAEAATAGNGSGPTQDDHSYAIPQHVHNMECSDGDSGGMELTADTDGHVEPFSHSDNSGGFNSTAWTSARGAAFANDDQEEQADMEADSVR